MVSQRRFFFFPYLIFHHRLPNSNYGIPALLRSKFCSIHPPLLRSILFRLLRHYRFFESSPASSEKRTRKKKGEISHPMREFYLYRAYTIRARMSDESLFFVYEPKMVRDVEVRVQPISYNK